MSFELEEPPKNEPRNGIVGIDLSTVALVKGCKVRPDEGTLVAPAIVYAVRTMVEREGRRIKHLDY